MTIIIHEWKLNYKTFLIWLIAIGAFCGGCMFLFPMMGDAMDGMEEAFASMGAFTQAFGLDQLSIGTAKGFFATEVGTIYALGGGMFAALMGIGLLSKEEGGHTAEFLYTLPLGRAAIFIQKYITMVGMLVLFGLINFGIFAVCFPAIGEEVPWQPLATYMLLQFLMQLEVSSVCYLISALTRRVQTGLGLGLALVFYMMDLMSRITQEMEALKYLTPFYYANASTIFTSDGEVELLLIGLSLGITILSVAAAGIIINRRDLSS